MTKKRGRPRKPPKTKEVRIGSEKIVFKYMSFSKDIEEAKAEWEGKEYIGSSSMYYINGVYKRHPFKLHFFK